ncbi:MAG TPA: prepilin peptidase [Candidatus Moranbacteria bacterium]|jgi:leader peptidase (prepilin peptidase)/N-methyltransferase|nr:prepilin peptidase [Candidatus Moranbacteria bacterium]HOF42691.1 prepilin peptidase [Candidatus Moranbacteria bacterium]HPX94550.1 prepilin peptidase [Candidatus Moranbacteria bacterium]HQB59983.1 prepilin peptidase [Candidatus Moranbacteria bacterium]
MTIIFFILGLIVGSFLNVVVYRLNQVESILGRSRCPHCKKKIRWFDNIPLLSFFLLSARCRDCGDKISWQYPLVEFSTGVVFALIGNYFFLLYNSSTWALTAYYLIIFSLLMVILVYDIKYMEIPMLILWLGVGITLAFFLYFDWRDFNDAMSFWDFKTISGLFGGLVAFLFFFALASYSKETWMGFGDAYLGLLAGFIVGWPNIIATLMISFAIGAAISVGLIMLRKKTMKSQIPFAPFLIAGTFLVVVLPQIFPVLKNIFIYI